MAVVRLQGGWGSEDGPGRKARLRAEAGTKTRRLALGRARQPPGSGSGQSHTCPESVGALTVSVMATGRRSRRRRGFGSKAAVARVSARHTHVYKSMRDIFMYPINTRRHPPSSALRGWRHNILKDAQTADTAEYVCCMVYSTDPELGAYAFIHPSRIRDVPWAQEMGVGDLRDQIVGIFVVGAR